LHLCNFDRFFGQPSGGGAVDAINWATLWCSGAAQGVRHKNMFGALEIKYHDQNFVWEAFFENVFSTKGWQQAPQFCKKTEMCASYRLYNA